MKAISIYQDVDIDCTDINLRKEMPRGRNKYQESQPKNPSGLGG